MLHVLGPPDCLFPNFCEATPSMNFSSPDSRAPLPSLELRWHKIPIRSRKSFLLLSRGGHRLLSLLKNVVLCNDSGPGSESKVDDEARTSPLPQGFDVMWMEGPLREPLRR